MINMKCHKTCANFTEIKNTDSTRSGICTFPSSYFPAQLDKECPFAPDPNYQLICKDCFRYDNDYACFTAHEDDLVGDCAGYIDKVYSDISSAIEKLLLQGRYDENKLQNVITEVVSNFKIPKDREE